MERAIWNLKRKYENWVSYFWKIETRELEVGGEKILISGLLPPYQYYKKGGKDFF